jgi:hypothetical protein
MAARKLRNFSCRILLVRECVGNGVHRSPRALDHAVRNVLRGNRRVFGHVPCRARRPGLSALPAANAKSQREKY